LLEKLSLSGLRWLMPVILASQEVEIRGPGSKINK
jgi:hypothetical protein